MELVRWEPFAGLNNLHSVFDDLFDGTLERAPLRRSLTKWHPAIDVLEGPDAYLLRAELPGMKREDIKVEVKDGALVLSGETKTEKPAEGVEYLHVERAAAKFWRSFTLPENANQESVAASYKDGILEIRVAKREETKPKQIQINVQ